MRREFSYGIIPLRRKQRRFEVFMIRHHAGHWGFPKGHPEADEEPKIAAARELQEETGFKVKAFLAIEPLVEIYKFTRQGHLVDKQVTYFLAEVEGRPKLQKEEVLEGGWISVDAIEEKATFAESKALFRQVRQLTESFLTAL